MVCISDDLNVGILDIFPSHFKTLQSVETHHIISIQHYELK